MLDWSAWSFCGEVGFESSNGREQMQWFEPAVQAKCWSMYRSSAGLKLMNRRSETIPDRVTNALNKTSSHSLISVLTHSKDRIRNLIMYFMNRRHLLIKQIGISVEGNCVDDSTSDVSWVWKLWNPKSLVNSDEITLIWYFHVLQFLVMHWKQYQMIIRVWQASWWRAWREWRRINLMDHDHYWYYFKRFAECFWMTLAWFEMASWLAWRRMT